MITMTKYDLEPITKTFYDALEEGTVLGRKCTRCGHIEFPPYLCCNACGNLDTEWVDMTNVRGVVKQVLPTRGAFGDPDFRNAHGDYFAVEVVLPNCDPVGTSLLHVDYDKYDEFDKLVGTKEVTVKPLIIQDEDTKVVVWELDGDSEFKKIPEIKAVPKADKEPKAGTPAAQESASAPKDSVSAAKEAAQADTQAAGKAEELDEAAKTVIACAADAYGVEESVITLATDIREELSNESMKMIVMISSIEDETNVTLEIQEANNLFTIADFVNVVRERM